MSTSITIKAEDVTQDLFKETATTLTSKALGQSASKIHSIADDVLKLATTTQGRADALKAVLANFDEMTSQAFAQLQAIDKTGISAEMRLRYDAAIRDLNKAQGFFQAAKQAGMIGDSVKVLGKSLGVVVGSLDLLVALKNNASQATVSKEALVFSAGLAAAIAAATSPAWFAIGAAVGVSVATKLAWDYGIAPMLDNTGIDLSKRFWDGVVDNLGLRPQATANPWVAPAVTEKPLQLSAELKAWAGESAVPSTPISRGPSASYLNYLETNIVSLQKGGTLSDIVQAEKQKGNRITVNDIKLINNLQDTPDNKIQANLPLFIPQKNGDWLTVSTADVSLRLNHKTGENCAEFYNQPGQTVIKQECTRDTQGRYSNLYTKRNAQGNLLEQKNTDVPPSYGTHFEQANTLNHFTLDITTNVSTKRQKALDHQQQTNAINNGLIASGGNWRLSFDADRLNNDQYFRFKIDNTSAAAQSQILSDHWRPGNGNVVAPVIDYSLASNVSGYGLKPPSNALTGSWLNQANAFAQTIAPTDPLVLDLNGDGVKLTSYAADPVLFDTDNDGGSLEQTGWVSPEDGLVVVDRNGNGSIDNMSEVLSEYYAGTVGSDGTPGEKRYKDGFAALKSLDSNQDNLFNSLDTAWESVKVWQDTNHDGKTDAGELLSLNALGITQINLSNVAQSGEVRDGNEVLARGSFIQNGQTREVLAANFLSNPNGSTVITSNTGTVVNTQAGGKASATSSYIATSNTGEVIDVADKGVNNAVGGTGNDTLIGDANNNWLVGGQGSDTFDAGAGDDVLIIDADDIQTNIHAGEGIDVVQIVGNRGVTLNLAEAEVEIAQGGRGDDVLIGGGRSSVYMRGGDGDDTLIGGAASDALSGENGDDFIAGAAGNDVLRGHRGRDHIEGGLGDDLIDGGADDDRLFGDAGNDVIKGGSGDDYIDGGDGIDVVELSGTYAEYRITKTANGIWLSDTVSGRDGSDFLRNIERVNFKDIKLVELPSDTNQGLVNPSPVKDVLHQNKYGQNFNRHQTHLIAKEQILNNDIDWQDDVLKISELFDVTGGTAIITNEGDVLFTPDAHATGFMSFKYTITDSKGNGATQLVNGSLGQSAVMRASVYLKTPDLPNDPLLTEQWYLAAANVLPVWKDYSGKGIRIGQFEPSGDFSTSKEILDYRHPDLKNNIDRQWLANATPGQLAGEGSGDHFSSHATEVAGVMVAARNGDGIVGAAYDATVAGYWVSGTDLSNLAYMRQYDIVNHSWGVTDKFAQLYTPVKVGMSWSFYDDAIRKGRNGLGTIIIAAGGNDRESGSNTNYSNISNTRTSIVVGAINGETDLATLQFGGQPFSNPGANILVSAPGSNITATSRLILGNNGSSFGTHNQVTQGTSFASPLVSGIVALMLEANPHLGYRDVQKILAVSAKKINDPATQWQTNSSNTWNGGGMHISHDYGYGEVDARAAVRLAETWITQQTRKNEFHAVPLADSGKIDLAITDSDVNGTSHHLHLNIRQNSAITIEHVEVHINLTHARPGDLVVKLISPSGTESILINRPGKAPGSPDSDRGDHHFSHGSQSLNYVLSTARLRGESANGQWTLKVIDTVTGDSGILHNWSMNVYGELGTIDDQYIYTNEFAQLASSDGRNKLHDTDGGKDTINAAAISHNSQVNLETGLANLAGADLIIETPSNIENIIGGEFNDNLTGNALDNVLVGGHGDDILSGGDGMDILFGGTGNNILTGGNGEDIFIFEHSDLSRQSKKIRRRDVITDFELGVDRIVLSGFRSNMTYYLNFTQIGTDTVISFQGELGFDFDSSDDRAYQAFFRSTDYDDVGHHHEYSDDNDALDDDSESEADPSQTYPPYHDCGYREIILKNVDLAAFLNNADLENDRSAHLLSVPKGVTVREVISAQHVIFGRDADRTPQPRNPEDKTNTAAEVVLANDSVTMWAGDGHDRIFGGSGHDTIHGGDGDDYLIGDPTTHGAVGGNDTLYGDAGDDLVRGGGGNDVLYGGAGLDILTGDAGDDILYLENDEALDKHSLAQTQLLAASTNLNGTELVFAHVLGGSGNDRFVVVEDLSIQASIGLLKNLISDFEINNPNEKIDLSQIRAVKTFSDLNFTTIYYNEQSYLRIWLGAVGRGTQYLTLKGIEATSLSANHFVFQYANAMPSSVKIEIKGTNGDDLLTGDAGGNYLDGGFGNDTMAGYSGDDSYGVDSIFDIVQEEAGGGYDLVKSSRSYTLPTNVEALTLIGQENINGIGNDLPNRMVGNDGHNILDGRAGADMMLGGRGDDSYIIDNTADRVIERPDEGIDTIISSVSFTLEKNIERLLLSGTQHIGGTGNDANNRLRGNEGFNHLIGGAGHDSLDGGAGDDQLYGGIGNDRLVGGAGNDSLDGGAGNDVLIGEAGDDIYLFYRGMGQDYISDKDNTVGNLDIVKIADGINSSDLQVQRDEDDLLLLIVGTNEGVRIGNWFANDDERIEQIQFADGMIWDVATINTIASSNTDAINNTFYGQGWSKSIKQARANITTKSAGVEGEEVNGLMRKDAIYAYGEIAQDTVFMYSGIGFNTVVNANHAAGKIDLIKIDQGISPTDLKVTRNRNDLILTAFNGVARLTIRNGFSHTQVQFYDGTTWDNATIRDKVRPTVIGAGAISAEGYREVYGYDDVDDDLDGTDQIDRIYGLDGDDVLSGGAGNDLLDGGEGNDILKGGEGHDELRGGQGEDLLDGGAGNDTLLGGKGRDTFLMYRGMGQDIIQDYPDWDTIGNYYHHDHDVIKVLTGTDPADIRLSRDVKNLYISIQGTSDQLTVRNLFSWGLPYIAFMQFSDGTRWDYRALENLSHTNIATENDDILYGKDLQNGTSFYKGSRVLIADDVLNGLAGNDSLYGFGGDDKLYGGSGDDIIDGGSGDDYIDGGQGNDQLDGSWGSDTYFFRRGDGQDTISERDHSQFKPTQDSTGPMPPQCTDTILIDVGVSAEQLWFKHQANDLVIQIIGTEDSMTIKNWYVAGEPLIEKIKLADGKTLIGNQVEGLVNAMAEFSPPAVGQTTLSSDYQAVLTTMIAASWN